MTPKYNNPRVEKIYPINGRTDFFKFAVMDGDKIAESYENNSLVFDDKKQAERIVKARIVCNKKMEQAAKPKKYKYYKVIQQYYGTWEDVSSYETDSQYNVIDKEEFKGDYKAYKENQPQYALRTVNRKELNPDYNK